MNYTIIKKLPPLEEIIKDFPIDKTYLDKIKQDKQEIKDILSGKDNRFIMIVGPCSAWPNTAVLEYAQKLQVLNVQLSDVLKIVMRVYIQKPRTTTGWTGPVNQPDPFNEPDIEAGIKYVRKMMLDVIKMGLPISDEALFAHHAKGFVDLLSWAAIGARSAEDQKHRIFASSIDCAVGLKNPTHGSLKIGVNSIIAAQHSHVAVFDDHEVKTHGNPFAHLVLRGSNQGPNYSKTYLEEAREYMRLHHIKNPAIIIDASHDNCLYQGKKDHHRQAVVIHETLDILDKYPSLKSLIKGFMIESFIKDGHQKSDAMTIDMGGLSITDPCLSWDRTEPLLLSIAERLRHEAIHQYSSSCHTETAL